LSSPESSADRAGACDVAIVGGGIIATGAAAYLAETGRSVTLFERAEIAAAASGRNSGSVQHPFDPVLAELHRRSIELYRDPRLADAGFQLPETPAGLLLVSFDEEATAAAAAELARAWPKLTPAQIPAGEAVRLEPLLDARLAGCRIETGYPVAPAAATQAFARRAEAAGAQLRTSTPVRLAIDGGCVSGVVTGAGETVRCEQVLVAAGPWTPSVIPGWEVFQPIRSVWGVVASVSLAHPPTHVLEELGLDRPGAALDRLFSIVAAEGRSSVGSTFLSDEPDIWALVPEILERARRFVPSLVAAAVESVRACARPVAFDGRPLIGSVAEVEELFVCAGHGPWGISTGPASAEQVVLQMLDLADEKPELSPARARPSPGANTEFA
jgi:glycine/D-amino acid oxidase-like deaminating enzyme